MINVTFYTFAKKLNSTKQPTGGTSLACLVKSDSSIINPVIQVRTDPTAFNYVHIAAFNRYYYINDIVFNNGIWLVYCSVDVLASYKTTIGSTNAYCVRSAVLYDGELEDDAWTVTTDYTREISTSAAQYTWTGFRNGYYVVGIKGYNTGSIAGVTYYQLTAAKFTKLIRWFYTNSGSGTFFGNLAKGVIDSIYNISDFITSCRWYPFALDASSTEYDIYLGSLPVLDIDDTSLPALKAPILSEYPISVKRWDFTVPKHPQAAARGIYMNSAPYTLYRIMTPWGSNISLNSYYMRDLTTIRLELTVDFTTGQATLYLPRTRIPYGQSQGGSYNDFTTYINFGVEIPLSGTNVNIGGIVSNASEAIVRAFAGDTVGALASVGNALVNSIADPEPRGSSGGYAPLAATEPYLLSQFFRVAPTDYDNFGRPCCQVTTPATIGSGFMQFENFAVAINGTSDEANSINSYMVSGIYYE